MNLVDVIDSLVEEKGLEREQVTDIVCEGIQSAYQKKFPEVVLFVEFNKKAGAIEIAAEKEVVSTVVDTDSQISLRKARAIDSKAIVGDLLKVPFEEAIGRIEILTAKQVIASKIRSLELQAVYDEYQDKQGTIITGIVHKKERAGFAIKVGDVMALLPRENFVTTDPLKVGFQVKALLSEVLPVARHDYQLILDRASAEFVQKLIELEIPEVFEGIVEIKKIVRKPGYKTKAIVTSGSKEIDPVGTCVGVGGARIKPILRELGQEKIDLIEWTDVLEDLTRHSLKPAEIDKVEVLDDEQKAIVWLAQDQRSLAIGKMGQNISLASKLVGLEIQLQDLATDADIETLYENHQEAILEQKSKRDELSDEPILQENDITKEDVEVEKDS